MAIQFVEGWELYDGTGSPPTAFSSKWGTVVKNYTLDITDGANFGYGMSFGKDWTGTASYAQTPTLDAQGSWIVGMNLKRDTAARDGQFLRVYDGATLQLEFRLSGTDVTVYRGGTTLIHTFSSVLDDTGIVTWHHLQFKFTISTTVGTVECRYNNFDAGTDGTGLNTDAAASGQADSFMLTATQSAYRSSDWAFDDFWVCDTTGTRNNDWLGPLAIEGIYCDGDGYQSDWDASLGDTTVQSNVTYWSDARLLVSNDAYSALFASQASVNHLAGPGGASFHYVTTMTWPDFGAEFSLYDSASNFNVTFRTAFSRTETYDVKVAAGNVTRPTTGAELATLWQNPLSTVATFSNPVNGTDETVDISAIITEWMAQSSWDNTWDLVVMIGRQSGDTSSNFTYIQPYTTGYLTFDVTTSRVSAIRNVDENDFIEADVVGDIGSFTLAEPQNILGNVRAVVVNWSARKGGPSDSIDLRSFVRSGTTNGYGDTQQITTPYPSSRVTDVFELNPEASGVPWAREHLSNIEVGVELEG